MVSSQNVVLSRPRGLGRGSVNVGDVVKFITPKTECRPKDTTVAVTNPMPPPPGAPPSSPPGYGEFDWSSYYSSSEAGTRTDCAT